MTTLGVVEIEEYCAAVRSALADLGPDQVAELTEDLPDHLAEVLAEGEGTLIERLGEPASYAAELRTAAGLPPRDPSARPPRDDLFVRAAGAARRADRRLGQLFGAERFADVLGLLQPAWWLLRGWIVAQWLCDRGTWNGIVPQLGSYGGAGGLVVTLVCAAVSVLIGLRVRRGPNWARIGAGVVSTLIALWGITVLASASSNAGTAGGVSYVDSGPYASDLYVYDANGNLIPNARIYDQDGNPLDLGDGACRFGESSGLGEFTPDGAYTYPLCPNDPLPFRSGPGVVPSVTNGGPTGPSPATTPTPGPTTANAPSAGATTAATSSGSPTR